MTQNTGHDLPKYCHCKMLMKQKHIVNYPLYKNESLNIRFNFQNNLHKATQEIDYSTVKIVWPKEPEISTVKVR